MKPLYLIVHPQCISGWDRARQPKIASELDRIMEKENFVFLKESTAHIPKNLDKNREIRVCGAYKNFCVWIVHQSLVQDGYRAKIYDKASFSEP
jgi:hypothetical protein